MFNTWLDTFIEEKGVNPLHTFEFEDENGFHIVDFEVLIEFIKSLDEKTKESIKANFVKIDFHNGDVMHFFDYMAKGMVKL